MSGSPAGDRPVGAAGVDASGAVTVDEAAIDEAAVDQAVVDEAAVDEAARSVAEAPPPRQPAVVESWPGWPGMRVSLGVLALVAGAAALSAGQALLLPIVLAILLALLLTPAVDLVERLRLPRWLGALLVVVALMAALVGAATQLAAPAQRWLNPKSPEWRKLEFRIREVKRPLETIQGAQERVAGIAEGAAGGPAKPKPKEVVVERRDIFKAIDDAKPLLVGALSTIVLLYFLLSSGDLFLRKLIRVLPRLTDKKTAVGIARTIQVEIGRYFLTIAAINLALGVVTAGLMAWLGMPSPVFWGALVAALNFIPYAGPGVSLLLLTAGAFVSLDSWATIAAVPLSFFVLVLIEGQLLQPILVGRRLRLNVVVTFLAVLLWGWLWGLGGVVVAIPVLVVLKICADHVASLSALGEFISRD
ncbi:MAG TPA: AI-2E family transporter [Burkholderiaceae bacterium]|jgi:predicted PurR-regulated permease PerM|nr:AI-2E family transporter [Burkholderiaceae bacterium]